MKIKHQIQATLGGGSAITLVAILASVHQELITVGPWVLDSLLFCTGSLVLYGGFRGYLAGRNHWLSSKSQALEVQARAQQLRLEVERHEWDIRAIQADIHVKASRVYPNDQGHYPVVMPTVVDMLPEHLQGQIMTFQSHQSGQQQMLPERTGSKQGQEVDTNISVPTAPPFRAMSYLLTGEELPLCFSANGPVFGTITDLLSMAVTGKPGKGKTTALMYYVAILLSCGAQVTIWDPHGVMAELAVLNGKRLPNMPATAKVTYLDRKEDIIASLPALEADLTERDELYRPPHRQIKHPHLLLADELPLLAEFDEELKAKAKRNKDEDAMSLIRTIKRFVLEARKWNCYFIGSGQSMDAEILPTRVTENMSSRIVFFSSDRRARMAGLENDAIKKYLPIIRRAGSGVMVFDCARFDEPLLGAIPYITIEDLMAFLGLPMGRDRMEPLQPKRNDFRTGGTTLPEQDATIIAADRDDSSDGATRDDFEGFTDIPSNVRTFPLLGAQQPVERSDDTSEDRSKVYRFTEQEIPQFLAAWRASGSVDRAIQAMHKSAPRYRQHAKEIIAAYNTRQA